MRLYLKLTPNTMVVPFNYQRTLVGVFHKWLGENELHDDISLYSLSWLDGCKMRSDTRGLEFRYGATFCISSPLQHLHRAAVDGIFQNQEIQWGMRVVEVVMKPTPKFRNEERFLLSSPVLIKRQVEGQKCQQYFFYSDKESDTLITETLRSKMKRLDEKGEISLEFDRTYQRPKIRKTTFNDIDIKASMCPVIVKGDPELVAFPWDVGLGNCTGIGFGGVR